MFAPRRSKHRQVGVTAGIRQVAMHRKPASNCVMRQHDKARWLRPLSHDAAVTEIPSAYPWKHDCGECVPSTLDGIKVDAEALCHKCAINLGLVW
jgi:hypothetical protein